MTDKPMRKRSRVKRNDRYKVDFSDNTLEIPAELDRWVREFAADCVTAALESDETYASWPAVWNPRAPKDRDDPLIVELVLGIGRDDNTSPTLSFNLREALASYIDDCREDGSFHAGLTKIRDALRQLADDIDEAVALKDL